MDGWIGMSLGDRICFAAIRVLYILIPLSEDPFVLRLYSVFCAAENFSICKPSKDDAGTANAEQSMTYFAHTNQHHNQPKTTPNLP